MMSRFLILPIGERWRAPNFALLLSFAWLIVVAQLLADHWAETARTLSDMDDAMRLVEVREFIAGRGWFDLHEARLGPPAGYDTHWSRLIDVGIATLIIGFERITDGAMAERLARVLWPMLWLIPAMVGAALIAWRVAGRPAATIVLLLTILGLPAFTHFVPGRIDHHNVQIALAILIVAAAAWSDRSQFAPAAAGLLTGLAMAIGLESGPYVVLAGAALALRFIATRDGARPLALYGVCAGLAVVAAFLVSVAPAHWSSTACDAIAVNSVAAVVIAAGGLAMAATCVRRTRRMTACDHLHPEAINDDPRQGWIKRASAVAAAGAIAAMAYAAFEPQCLHGPFAIIDPMVRLLWFVHVSEMQPLWTLAATSPAMAAAVAAFPAVALVCALALCGKPDTRRDFGFLVAASALLMAIVVMAVMVRAMSYAVWLAIPIAAAGALQLATVFRVGTLLARALIALLLTPTVTSAMALAAVAAVTRQPPAPENSRVTEGCLLTTNYERLARLLPGLVATDIDYGPFVLALTPHSVLSAPYHRLAGPIIAAHQIFALPPQAARRVVEQTNPDYLVVCGRHTLGDITPIERAQSLWGQLMAGEVPAWLDPVSASLDEPLKIYRVRR